MAAPNQVELIRIADALEKLVRDGIKVHIVEKEMVLARGKSELAIILDGDHLENANLS